MIPIRTAKELKALDLLTIREEEIRGWDLMERAVEAFTEALLNSLEFDRVCICCGPGNNGGDGLGIARKLLEAGKEVETFVFKDVKATPEYGKNLKLLRKKGTVHYFEDGFKCSSPLLIDALFGYGLDRILEGKYAELVAAINASGAFVVSVDIPSGMPAEPGFKLSADYVVKANYVFTFHCPKLSMILPYAGNFCPAFDILDIGLRDDLDAEIYFLSGEDVSSVLKAPERFTYKHKRGHALIMGGSAGKSGAAILAAESALRTGCGLVHALVPSEVVLPLQVALPEAMYEITGKVHLKSMQINLRLDAIGMGPGMGMALESKEAVLQSLDLGVPLIIDADAVRLLASSGQLAAVPSDSIFTPHEGEFRALAGEWKNEEEKLNLLRVYCKKLKSVVLLKGAYTLIGYSGKIYVNSSGHPALATAGSGDVLLGIITSLRAQGYSALESAIIGAYIHGKAAEIYLERSSSATLIASDICGAIGQALHELQS